MTLLLTYNPLIGGGTTQLDVYWVTDQSMTDSEIQDTDCCETCKHVSPAKSFYIMSEHPRSPIHLILHFCSS